MLPSDSEDRRRRLFQLGAVVVTAVMVVMVAIAALGGPGPSDIAPGRPVPGAPEVLALFKGIPQHGDVLGESTAPLTVVEFGDLQCPSCAAFAENVLPMVVMDYVRSGQARIEFLGVGFLGSDSTRAAQMADAVGGQNHLWEFVDLMYHNQGLENSSYVSDRYLRGLAGAIPGLNVSRAFFEMSSTSVANQIAFAQKRANALRLRGTPALLVGRKGQALQIVGQEALDVGSLRMLLSKLLRMVPQEALP